MIEAAVSSAASTTALVSLQTMASFTGFPLAHAALQLAAIELAEGDVVRHVINELLLKPALDPAKAPLRLFLAHVPILPLAGF